MRSIAIGLLGAGNVGSGVMRILQENREAIERRVMAKVRVKHVLVRSPERKREVEVPSSVLRTDVEQVLRDPDVRIIVELIGGIEPAKTYVMEALRHGKHVVTANKALLALHGREIFAEAAAHGLSVFFEGSVAGGIPILRSLREGLASDRITSIIGIVNGTSNYVLDSMTRRGVSYEQALGAAQRAGYAEADPTFDVDGTDAAQKLALLGLVSFGKRVDPQKIAREGITQVRPFDIETADELGYVIKHLAIAQSTEQGLQMRVHPCMVPEDHVLAGVHGPYNAVLVESVALGRSLYYGQGAGMMPTGMAVVSDIIEICREVIGFSYGGLPTDQSHAADEVELGSLDIVRCENYLCAHVLNVPGILGRVASCLGHHGVSIKRMNQGTPGPGEPIDMVMLTEHVEDAKLRAAIAELDGFDAVVRPTDRIRILDLEPVE